MLCICIEELDVDMGMISDLELGALEELGRHCQLSEKPAS